MDGQDRWTWRQMSKGWIQDSTDGWNKCSHNEQMKSDVDRWTTQPDIDRWTGHFIGQVEEQWLWRPRQ